MEHCSYPPNLAADVEITPRAGSDEPSYFAGSAAIGRYLILGARERRVLELLDGSRTTAAVCEALGGLQVAELASFLSKLDELGILAGERNSHAHLAKPSGNRYYLRWALFDPDPLFTRVLGWVRWVWTPGFVAVSVAVVLMACLLAVLDWAEVAHYAGLAIRTQYLAIFLAAWLVTVCHEFSHGLTAKAFGGRSTEVGFLLIYFCMPAFYCNVSGIHMIPSRERRLWVIAAGIYSQVLIGFGALLVWFAFSPDTLLAQAAMALVLASLLDVAFNATPLIKLDGYYFLSQWLDLPNLMDRSRACWRDAGRRWLLGIAPRESSRFTARERSRMLVFGFFSFFFNVGLALAIVWFASQKLMDWFEFPGLLLSVLLAVGLALSPLTKAAQYWFGGGGNMANKKEKSSGEQPVRWRRLAPGLVVLAIVAGLLIPWTASVGSYGKLMAIPGSETIIRAPQDASLLVLSVLPGQQMAPGAAIAQMGNLDMDEQIATVKADLARVSSDEERLAGEMRVQRETTRTSEWQLAQRQREFDDLVGEEQQIRSRDRNVKIAFSSVVLQTVQNTTPAALPPALAALESDVDRLQASWVEASRQRDRIRNLAAQSIVARSELDAMEGRTAALASELAGARQKLSAALIEHERRHAKAQTEVQVARSGLAADQAQATQLTQQLEAARKLHASLGERLSLLERKRAQFTIIAPRLGTLFGDELPRMLGQYFVKGAEICRVADVRQLMVRVQVSEQSLSDIRLSQGVRVKSRTFPDRVFHGTVSKIGGESELDEHGDRTYRVELTIENQEGLLRPGMTVFSRADFGRRPIGWLLGHKLKQALRPELWML